VERLITADLEAALVLVQQLEVRLSDDPLRRIERVWQMSSSQVAALLGVSRQAYSKWHTHGVPAQRRDDVSHLDQATQLLLDHMHVGRMPAAVRRPAESLGGVNLIQLATDRGAAALHEALRHTFDLSRVQP
jgi:hypothetical protein